MAVKEKQNKEYIVIARSTETMKEMYAVAGTKRIPFDTPVRLSDAEVETIKRQREPVQMEKQVTIRSIMEEQQVSQAKANKMLELIAKDPNQGGKKITFVSKYVVYPA